MSVLGLEAVGEVKPLAQAILAQGRLGSNPRG